MGADKKKTYLPIAGVPILAHTIKVFDACMLVDSIIVVVAEQDIAECEEMIAAHCFLKVHRIVSGGATRQESVLQGLKQIPGSDLVIVHDAVRPLVTQQIIEDCVQAAYDFGAATAAVPVKDTIKLASPDAFVERTLDRNALWATQTPQVFRYALLIEAHRVAHEQGLRGTDDASLVEQLGHPVKLVHGDYRNLKITTPEDLAVANALMARKL